MPPRSWSGRPQAPTVNWYLPSRSAPAWSFQERRLTLLSGLPAPRKPASGSWIRDRELALNDHERVPPIGNVEFEDEDATDDEYWPTFTTAFVALHAREPLYRTAINAFREWVKGPAAWCGSSEHD